MLFVCANRAKTDIFQTSCKVIQDDQEDLDPDEAGENGEATAWYYDTFSLAEKRGCFRPSGRREARFPPGSRRRPKLTSIGFPFLPSMICSQSRAPPPQRGERSGRGFIWRAGWQHIGGNGGAFRCPALHVGCDSSANLFTFCFAGPRKRPGVPGPLGLCVRRGALLRGTLRVFCCTQQRSLHRLLPRIRPGDCVGRHRVNSTLKRNKPVWWSSFARTCPRKTLDSAQAVGCRKRRCFQGQCTFVPLFQIISINPKEKWLKMELPFYFKNELSFPPTPLDFEGMRVLQGRTCGRTG